MKSPQTKTTVPRSDPTLKEKLHKDAFRPSGLPKWVGLLLYGVFWVLLLVPLVRRWRRGPNWQWIRMGIAVGGMALAAAGLYGANDWVTGAGALVLLSSLIITPAPDPDRERKLQRLHRADYLLNGGTLVSGTLPSAKRLPVSTPLYLLLRGRELLIVPRGGDGQVHSILSIDDIQEILVSGEPYLPVYVSEAKDPPVREERVDRSAATEMELVMKGDNTLRFKYAGAFSKHLAETAAHAIYSVRKLSRSDTVGGQPPEIFHVVGR